MEGAFYGLVAILVGIYAGYPLALRVAVGRMRRAPAAPPPERELPVVTVLVPAHDEEAVIGEKVRNLLALDYPEGRIETIVISDGSTDGTCAAARRAAPSATVRVEERATRTGKTVALSRTVPLARGDLLVFTDANALFRSDAVRRLASRFVDPEVGLVCGRLRYRTRPTSEGSPEGLYWRYEDAIKRWEGRLGRLLVANGSIYAVRRELFEEMPGAVADDFVMPLLVASRGFRVDYEPDAVAEELLPSRSAEDFRSKARIVARGFEAMLRYRGRILRSGPVRVLQYLMHKLLRWLAPLLLIALLAVSIGGRHSSMIALALLAQLGFYALALLGFLLRDRRPPALARVPFYFCLVNAAALKGLGDFLRRRRHATWEKSATTREVRP